APHGGDAAAGARRGSALHPGAAGARVHRDDAALHPRCQQAPEAANRKARLQLTNSRWDVKKLTYQVELVDAEPWRWRLPWWKRRWTSRACVRRTAPAAKRWWPSTTCRSRCSPAKSWGCWAP